VVSVEEEFVNLKRGLKAEQKRGFDAKLGLLNTIASTLTQVTLIDRATPWGPDTQNHRSAAQVLYPSDTLISFPEVSGVGLVDLSKVGFTCV